MKVQVAKWGNSLAIRLPIECVRAAGLPMTAATVEEMRRDDRY